MTQFDRCHAKTYIAETPFQLSRKLYNFQERKQASQRLDEGMIKIDDHKSHNTSCTEIAQAIGPHRPSISSYRKREFYRRALEVWDEHKRCPSGQNWQTFVNQYSSSSQFRLLKWHVVKSSMFRLSSAHCGRLHMSNGLNIIRSLLWRTITNLVEFHLHLKS